MEWVAHIAGEPHSDTPACVSPVLTRFCIAFNDALPDEERQKLRPYLARTIGTRDDGLDESRAWLATDWLIRTYTPTWLELAGLDEIAGRLRALPPVLTVEDLNRAMVDVRAVRGQAAAAGDAAWAAAWAAARDAARDAAGDAARAAARAAAGTAARDAAGDAAWGAARTAARDAAGDAARAAAREAARTVAGEAAKTAAGAVAWDAARNAAGAAAWDAARNALVPTVSELQRSAFGLLDRMLPTEIVQLPVASDADPICGEAMP